MYKHRYVIFPFRQLSKACRKIPVRKKRRYASKSERDLVRHHRPPQFKRQASRSMKAVSVACSPQFIVLLVLVIVICLIMAGVLIVMFNMFNRKQDAGNNFYYFPIYYVIALTSLRVLRVLLVVY